MPDEETDEDLAEGEEESKEREASDKASKLKSKRREEFRKKYVPRAEFEKLKADLTNREHEEELDNADGSDPDGSDEADAGDGAGSKPSGNPKRSSEGEKEGPTEGKRGRVFPFPHEA